MILRNIEFIESYNMDNVYNNNELPMSMIHHIFDTYLGSDYKLLIHKEGSTDEDRRKVLSIELMMISGMEDYFRGVLLSRKFKVILCDEACKRGYVGTLKWAHENGCPWDTDTCRYAAKFGHLHCLQWAHENGCPWDTDTCRYAAEFGHLHCLQWARENGCPWNTDTCRYAAKNGHLNCLQWAHENGCQWNVDTCAYAARNGHLHCLQWAHENGCPWDRDICLHNASSVEVFTWILSTAV